jgi:EAL domain-containing protein (putative c-di-GMP-specific phosphodiesterase class I)
MVIFKSLDMAKEKNVQMSINISKKDILNSEFLKELKEKIKTLGIGNQITFEITESEDISHHRYLKNFIVEFRDIGVKFAIDDFGSGFSNFSFILEVSPDFIKIDGSLIKNIDSSKNSYELVKSIVAFSHALDKKVVAEFVHSKEVFDIAYELGIDLFQGYYFAQPALEI